MDAVIRIIVAELMKIFAGGIILLRHANAEKVPDGDDRERPLSAVGITQCEAAWQGWFLPFQDNPAYVVDAGSRRTVEAGQKVCAEAILWQTTAPELYFNDPRAADATLFNAVFHRLGHVSLTHYLAEPGMQEYFAEYAWRAIMGVRNALANQLAAIEPRPGEPKPMLVIVGHGVTHQAIALMMADAVAMSTDTIVSCALGEAEALLLKEGRVEHLKLTV